jgi:hypothetical protein
MLHASCWDCLLSTLNHTFTIVAKTGVSNKGIGKQLPLAMVGRGKGFLSWWKKFSLSVEGDWSATFFVRLISGLGAHDGLSSCRDKGTKSHTGPTVGLSAWLLPSRHLGSLIAGDHASQESASPHWSMSQSKPYHITQPDSLEKRDYQPCLCGSNDGKRVAFASLRSFLAASIIKEEEVCKDCFAVLFKRYWERSVKLE